NKDWEHWVVLHGNEQVVREDVRELGQTIGVNFNGASVNMFDVLSRGGRGSKKLNVPVEGEGLEATGEGGESGGGRCEGSRGEL
ncbi:endonuclease/exonuclease/phosphatase family protein, partial [Trifolium medium]|nr:endonuclease/exonuclease/phosphatase family protein [Trifolium medium]